MNDADLPQAIFRDYFRVESWRMLASLDRYAGINFVTLRRYAHGDTVLNEQHREILGLPKIIVVASCPNCGDDCWNDDENYDCSKKRITAKPGTGRRRAPRVEIALNDPIKARARLEEKLREYHGVDLL